VARQKGRMSRAGSGAGRNSVLCISTTQIEEWLASGSSRFNTVEEA